MCVIAFSPKGVSIPSVEQLKSMWKANPDGAGYAYVGRGGKVYYRKGFMTLDSLLKELEAPERFKNTNFAIHFRIGTSGKNDAKTCHPFPVTTSFGELRKTEGKTDALLFHNGIIGEGKLTSPLSSDTQDFVIAMAPLLYKYNKSKARDHYIEDFTEGNRLLLLYKNNAFKMYGDWKKDGDLWVSNLNYKNDYRWYGGEYYSDWWDDWYRDYYKNNKPTNPTVSSETEVAKSEPVIDSNEKIGRLWNDIIKREYAYVTPQDLTLLKHSADDYDREHIYVGGFTFGYDAEQELVWVEDTPVNYYKEYDLGDEEEDAIMERDLDRALELIEEGETNVKTEVSQPLSDNDKEV